MLIKTPEQIAATKFTFDSKKAAEKTLNTLEAHGVFMPPSPDTIDSKDKEFPKSFDNLTPYDIMNKIATFTSLFAYTSVLEATAKTEVAAYERELETAEATEYILCEAKEVTTKKAMRDASDTVIAVKEKLTLAEARHNILKAMRESFERYIFAMSRYVSVLQSENNAY